MNSIIRFSHQVIHTWHLANAYHRISHFFYARRAYARNAKVITQILETLSKSSRVEVPATWRIRRIASVAADLPVVVVGPARQEPAAVVKLAPTDLGRRSLHRRCRALEAFQKNENLKELHKLVPSLIAQGEMDGQEFVVEQMIVGIEASKLLDKPQIRERLQKSATELVLKYHRLTATPRLMDEALLSYWITTPGKMIVEAMTCRDYVASVDVVSAVESLEAELKLAFAGRMLNFSWVHGDFMPGNIILSKDGLEIIGIIDLEASKSDGLAYLDLLQLFLSIRMAVNCHELGDVVIDLLKGKEWLPYEQALLDQVYQAQFNEDTDRRALLLLCWLQHVAANLLKSVPSARLNYWLQANVESVLRYVAH